MNLYRSAAAIVLGIAAIGSKSQAAQIPLIPTDVIGGSVAYPGVPFNTGQFNATQILDNQTGIVAEPTQNGYWLNPDNGPADGYIVIDLGAANQISEIDMFNTHNSQFNDRGTGKFAITGANAVVDTGGGNFDISGPSTVILSATLTGQFGDFITDQVFLLSDPGAYRYIRFDALSVAVGGTSCCGANNYGLNEIRLFNTPEPASISLFGIGAAGLVARRRRA